jgi:hypothetical protein
MLENFSAESRRALVLAQEAARQRGNTRLGAAHIVLGAAMLLDDEMKQKAAPLILAAKTVIGSALYQPGPPGNISLSEESEALLEAALVATRASGRDVVTPIDLLSAAVLENQFRLLMNFHDVERTTEAISEMRLRSDSTDL